MNTEYRITTKFVRFGYPHSKKLNIHKFLFVSGTVIWRLSRIDYLNNDNKMQT